MYEALKKLSKKEISMHEVEQHVSNVDKACEVRRKFIEKSTKTDLSNIGSYTLDAETAMKKNVENMIGVAQLPLGVAGPVKIKGTYAKGSVYLPLATTEGALIASISRGCKVINESGGATSFVVDDKMTRAPVFVLPSAKKANEFATWIIENKTELKKKTEEKSRFLKVKQIKPWIVGRNVFIRFSCSTGDAMGMNMVTIGVANACRFMTQKFKAANWIATSGNMCVDKKPSAMNFIEGRGKTVIAEIEIPEDIVNKVLKTTSSAMAEVNYRKNMIGSAQAGSYGFNANTANIVAGMFIACGQDPAQVVSGSMGFTLCEATDKGLHASVTLPAICVGTVGGGTALATQNEALQMLGCAGSGTPAGSNARKLAEIIATGVLAGEISLVGALAAHHLAKAHSELGR